jgi:hypothetical protein
MQQTTLAPVEDTPAVLKARLKREWEALEARKQAGEVEDNVERAQMLTTYLEQGLTQREIQQTVGVSQVYVGHLLRYHRFLIATAIKMPEWRFRAYWHAHTDPAALRDLRGEEKELARLVYEQQAFQEIVEEHMKGEGRPPEQKQGTNKATRQLAKRILTAFSDGKFHLLRDIATAVEADMGVVGEICNRIVRNGAYQMHGERRPAAPAQGSYTYRFVKGGNRKVDVRVLEKETKPLWDDLDNLVNGHRVDFNQQAIKEWAARYRQVVDRVAR